MTDISEESVELFSRLELIADQPLAERAEALGQIYQELRELLESGDQLS